jgi:UDP-2-acetamido-2,6-beta-L-arabino-hexul-4-ose reductase
VSDVVYHLAGVNRPEKIDDFETGNVDVTRTIVSVLEKLSRKPYIVMSSSTQAELDNPYGKSKKKAEEVLLEYSKKTGAKIFIYRLPGVFGKWSKPNYNTVVATFCYNIARGLDIAISDRNSEIELVYIDDVVNEFINLLNTHCDIGYSHYYGINKTFKVTLGELADKIYQLHDIRNSLMVPDLSGDFMKYLHATYASFLDEKDFSYPLKGKVDNRGCLFELIKSEYFGQIFVSKTHKGVIRGNHYHNSKVEKFCVIKGKAVIRFRNIITNESLAYHVSDEKIEIVDIPPGYTHSIENVSDGAMIVLFWANQILDQNNPDTYYCEV